MSPPPAKPNQGMRQPQLGGIGSRLDQTTVGAVCRHKRQWRRGGAEHWVCAVCHPPAAPWPDVEYRERD